MSVTSESNPESRILVIEDPRYLDHEAPSGHPERPERLIAVARALESFETGIVRQLPEPADPSAILRIHTREHLETVRTACLAGRGHLDADTFVSRASFDTALLATGGAVQLARQVARGNAPSGFAIVRPPGHHAERVHAMGFCLFNNVAVAARTLQKEEGVERILIVDWDVHHGNGTQHSFEEDPSVLFVSTHQFPFYPGTGDFVECGRGPGEGATLNIPMPAGCGDTEYTGALQRLLVPAARAFRPEIILVSCGFDAHRADPLASMEISAEGFLQMTRTVRALAEDLCGGRIGFVLEGGYAPTSLFEGTASLLRALLEPAWDGSGFDGLDIPEGNRLRRVVDQVREVHASRYPGLGAL